MEAELDEGDTELIQVPQPGGASFKGCIVSKFLFFHQRRSILLALNGPDCG